MPRYAFVVGNGFVVDQRASSEIRRRDDDAARAFAIRSASYVVSCCGRLECGDSFNGDWRFRKQGKQLRKFRLHLGNVVTEIVEDLLRGSRNVFGIGFERRAECGKIREAFLL